MKRKRITVVLLLLVLALCLPLITVGQEWVSKYSDALMREYEAVLDGWGIDEEEEELRRPYDMAFLKEYAKMLEEDEQTAADLRIQIDTVYGEMAKALNLEKSEIELLYNNRGLSGEKHLLLQQLVEEYWVNIQQDAKASDEDKIKTTMELLFFLSTMNYRDMDDYDFSVLMAEDPKGGQYYFMDRSNTTKMNEKTVRDIEYLTLDDLNKYVRWIVPEILELKVMGNTAVVKAEVHEYSVYAKGAVAPDVFLGEARFHYEMEFCKDGEIWYNTNVRSNTSEERYFTENGTRLIDEVVVTPEKAAEIKEGIMAQNEETLREKQRVTDNIESAAWTTTNYYTSWAVSYARAYALSYNSFFGVHDADCQNFASQSVWKGFGGVEWTTGIEGHYAPMVDLGISHARSWYQGKARYDTPTNWAWTHTTYFMNYLTAGGNVVGPYGFRFNGVAYARVGDIIDYYTSSGIWHAYVVTGVTGTYGSRSPSNITVCAHTDDVKDAQLPVTSDLSRYRTKQIEAHLS